MGTSERAKSGTWRRRLGGVLLAVAVTGLLGGCAGQQWFPSEPTYTDAELKAMCQRRGGWWRGDLIAGYCEYQAASLSQSP